MEYNPNGKGTTAPGRYNPLFLTPMEKSRFYEKSFFELVTVMIKDKKIQHKR